MRPAAVFSLALGLLGALVATADGDDGLVLCPFRRCTGGYCPGCGGTRAARNLLRGDIGAAWAHNPWAVLLGAQLGAMAAALALARSAPRRRAVIRMARGRPLLFAAAINVVTAVAIWATRLHSGAIPTGWF